VVSLAGSTAHALRIPARLEHAVVKNILNYMASGMVRFGNMRLGLQILALSAVAVLALFLIREPGSSFADLWLTADQQGRLLFERKEYAAAAAAFRDPAWQGEAHYRKGEYAEAAEAFARQGDATGFYNRGNAFMKAFEYRKAITAYEQAVNEAPDWLEARENLELARYTLDYIERAREQSDTGEEAGIGADDTVYDNESDRGAETEVSRESALEAQSAEKWMRAIDTETSEFLRTRFLLEAVRSGER
jgi:Ca-activated chloride channel family protein